MSEEKEQFYLRRIAEISAQAEKRVADLTVELHHAREFMAEVSEKNNQLEAENRSLRTETIKGEAHVVSEHQ